MKSVKIEYLDTTKKKEELSINDKKTGKEAMLRMMRLASFRQCIDEVDDQVRRLLQEKRRNISLSLR